MSKLSSDYDSGKGLRASNFIESDFGVFKTITLYTLSKIFKDSNSNSTNITKIEFSITLLLLIAAAAARCLEMSSRGKSNNSVMITSVELPGFCSFCPGATGVSQSDLLLDGPLPVSNESEDSFPSTSPGSKILAAFSGNPPKIDKYIFR